MTKPMQTAPHTGQLLDLSVISEHGHEQSAPDFEAAQSPTNTSPLNDIPSLRTYFERDMAHIGRLRCDPDWLRDKANQILIDQAGKPECLFKFAKGWLAANLLFGPAAKIDALALAKYGDRTDLFSNRLRHQLALTTYKNEEAPTRQRLNAALAILEAVRSIAESDQAKADDVLADQAETWALRGAVHRRLWDLDGKVQNLHRALDCYRRSHCFDDQRTDAHVTGYGALNAAFLLDSLAFHLNSIGDGPILRTAAQQAREESRTLRLRIVERLGKRMALPDSVHEEWLCETVSGSYLALGLAQWARDWETGGATSGLEPAANHLENARSCAVRAVQRARPDWMRETTHAQWLRIGLINEPRGASREVLEMYWTAAAEVINPFRERCGGIVLAGWELAGNARRGKVGLALSGGGFRASFYHLGVLARLAEVDALRHIDVLSTVSGGSIVGAHYYLLLRQLLQQKEAPTRDDYIKLILTLQQQFCAGVDENLRMRGLSNFWVTLKLLFKPNYTRSDRMAELYDERLFALTEKGDRPRFPMTSLKISPAGEETFNPRFSNWRRSARVPVLLVNATCLNTGHSWHFTTNWMGEPPELIGESVDKNERLRRVPYEKARGYKSLSLGFAVAASACVPGIFEPLRLPRLYPGRLVRLVDGGVHDNQGVDALLGQGCAFILCSDGSGQMGDEMRPSNGPVGTPKRSMDILMKRVREAEHIDVANRVTTGTQRGFFFVHLKSELPIYEVDWARCDDPTRPQERKPATYGIDREIQRLLSEIRTDLDSFSEVEVCALMASGYMMTVRQLEQLNGCDDARDDCYPWGGFDIDAPMERTRWRFLELTDRMAVPKDTPDVVRRDLGRQLRAGRDLFLKQLRMSRGAASALAVALLLAFGAASWAVAASGEALLIWMGAHGWHANYIAIGITAIVIIIAAAWPRFRVWCVESFFALFGLIVTNLYFVLRLNRSFLKRGKLDRLLELT
jgi:predicted acylesterase/phospholipase RssA